MKKERLLAGALALALLTGCSGGKEKTSGLAAADDMAYQAADIRRDAELITVDGEPILAEKYLFWLTGTIQSLKKYGELSDEAAWNESLADGMTMSQALKADALESAKLYRVVESKAAEYGVTLTAEQEAEMDEQLEQFIENVGGEEEFQAYLDSLCISRDSFISMNRVYFLNQGLKEKMEANGELTITPTDVEQVTTEITEQAGLYAAKHILLSTRRTNDDGSYEEFTEEERAEVEKKANELRQQLRDAGDSEELFDELMNEYSEDGRDADGNLYAPDGYGLAYAGQMVPEFENGALALEVGEISEPIATAYGYHIIMRIPLDQEQLDDMVASYCTPDYKLQMITEEWISQAEVVTTTAYDELDPKAFYDRLTEITEAREAARKAAQSAAPTESPADSAVPTEEVEPETSPEASPAA